MSPIEFREMAYVLAVYEERSFSRAAEKQFVSQPSLSKIVRRVEKKLGVMIFDRGSVPLKATPEGERIMEYFRRHQALRQELERYCDRLRRQREYDLAVVAPSFFCTYVLPPLVSRFLSGRPDYQIKLMETNDNDLQDFLKSGIADIGISVNRDMPAELVPEILAEECIVLAVPREYPVNRGLERYALKAEDMKGGRLLEQELPAVPIERFASERFLFLKQGNDLYERGMRICRDAGFSPQVVMELDQLLTAYYLAAAGEGAAFIRASIPHYAGRAERLCFYKIDHPDMVRPIRLLHNRSLELSEKQKLFIAYLRENLLAF